MKTLFILLICTIYTFALDFASIKTFQSKFIQIIVNPSGKILKYNGDIFIARPNHILWKYKTPIVKNVYINDSFAIIDEPELEQAIYTKIDQEVNLFDMINKAKKIDINHYLTKLNNVQYHIYTKDDKIDYITYTDTLENSVKILFLESQYNQDIDKNIFVFKAPSDYDIIRK